MTNFSYDEVINDLSMNSVFAQNRGILGGSLEEIFLNLFKTSSTRSEFKKKAEVLCSQIKVLGGLASKIKFSDHEGTDEMGLRENPLLDEFFKALNVPGYVMEGEEFSEENLTPQCLLVLSPNTAVFGAKHNLVNPGDFQDEDDFGEALYLLSEKDEQLKDTPPILPPELFSCHSLAGIYSWERKFPVQNEGSLRYQKVGSNLVFLVHGNAQGIRETLNPLGVDFLLWEIEVPYAFSRRELSFGFHEAKEHETWQKKYPFFTSKDCPHGFGAMFFPQEERVIDYTGQLSLQEGSNKIEREYRPDPLFDEESRQLLRRWHFAL